MMIIKQWFSEYFNFNRREFNGLMTLIFLILLVMAFPYVYQWIKPEEPITKAEQLAVLKLSLADQERLVQLNTYKKRFDGRVTKRYRLFVFDPNKIGQADWEKLGLSPKQAKAILKYRDKGGRFRKTQDLQKMYTINEVLYKRLVPYVSIANEEETGKRLRHPVYVKPELAAVEINGADTIELDKIKGIGMVFANRIVKYRERIGGFYKKEQLMEVFGLDSVKYNEIKGQVTLDAGKLKKININTAQFDDFKNHPYIKYKQVNALIQYRKQHGNYSNIADVYKVAIMNQETVSRLSPYLEF
ncbi:ComEA family DNA-binding protein [Pedobacter heparinus]|uniref:ComEA family DNA-binding protein n=1 Tax=Pedobacter heparinus TaxID=984 RepID=UPI002931F4CC|nr:helix-hairpin-helix domain-containing protein [Pedobacter heparinus]